MTMIDDSSSLLASPSAGSSSVLSTPVLCEFLCHHGIDSAVYNYHVPRYIRKSKLWPHHAPSVEEYLSNDLDTAVKEVPWLEGFYRLDDSTKNISNSRAYREGWIYGGDAASGAVVEALGLAQGMKVLDLCCAPGVKLCLISEKIGPTGRVYGVDVSVPRLSACSSMCAKYSVDNAVLIRANALHVSAATLLCTAGMSQLGVLSRPRHNNRRRKRRTKKNKIISTEHLSANSGDPEACLWGLHMAASATGAQRTASYPMYKLIGSTTTEGPAEGESAGDEQSVEEMSSLPIYDPTTFGEAVTHSSTMTNDSNESQSDVKPTYLFDRVLVDAECTHEGSIRHLDKFASRWGVETFERRVIGSHTYTAKETPLASVGSGGIDRSGVMDMSDLCLLQQRLLFHGFDQLRLGGILVYSTCSFCHCQNESVVQALLDAHPSSARLHPLLSDSTRPLPPCRPSALTDPSSASALTDPSSASALTDPSSARCCSAYFDPRTSETSGIFVACIKKVLRAELV
eukprot:GHVQ01024035.1.p1 GENE.GHVQ01024035.1~~GHVQ01024035.1.p1  ORF type:complete len:514 (+),score=104.06 GHVQ01024035.1:72-1613(+)